MGVYISVLDTTLDNADATTYSSADVAPGGDRWLVVDVANGTSAGTADLPSIGLNLGLTWTQETTSVSGTRRITRFYSRITTAPAPGPILVDFAAATQVFCDICVYEVQSDPSTLFVQSDQRTGTGTSTHALLALGAFADPLNVPLLVVWHGALEAVTPEAGYTAVVDQGTTGPSHEISVLLGSGEDLTPSASWTSSVGHREIVSEVKNGPDIAVTFKHRTSRLNAAVERAGYW